MRQSIVSGKVADAVGDKVSVSFDLAQGSGLRILKDHDVTAWFDDDGELVKLTVANLDHVRDFRSVYLEDYMIDVYVAQGKSRMKVSRLTA